MASKKFPNSRRRSEADSVRLHNAEDWSRNWNSWVNLQLGQLFLTNHQDLPSESTAAERDAGNSIASERRNICLTNETRSANKRRVQHPSQSVQANGMLSPILEAICGWIWIIYYHRGAKIGTRWDIKMLIRRCRRNSSEITNQNDYSFNYGSPN